MAVIYIDLGNNQVEFGDALLDIHANNVATPPLKPPPKPQKTKAECKENRHLLRKTAGAIMPFERVRHCGRKNLGDFVSLHCHDQQASYGGLETCSSVWMCPVCAVKITESRRTELEQLLANHRQKGGKTAMMTLTVPHHQFQKCRNLKLAVADSWRRLKQQRSWRVIRDACHWIGDIRALEVTHGVNGWHPHLHILVFFNDEASERHMHNYADWAFHEWSKAITYHGLGRCDRAAFKFDIIHDDQGIGEYVSKWGVAMEMTKAHTKQSKGGRTPWQILADYQKHGKEEDKRLFREYAKAFKGTRQLTWSRGFKRCDGVIEEGIRKRYDIIERTDEEICTEPAKQETHQATLDKSLFKQIVEQNLTATVLSALESGGTHEVKTTLTKHKIPWQEKPTKGMIEGQIVPLFTLNKGGA